MKFPLRNIMFRLTLAVLLAGGTAAAASAQEGHTPMQTGVFGRFRFSCEWGYVQSVYRDYHYNILSEEGYRINESYYGVDMHPNGLLLAGVGFVPPGELLMVSLHAGYAGIHEDNRVIPALLRMSFFPKKTGRDGMFYYAQAGAGFHMPKTLKTRVSLLSGIGAGYRFALTERCSIDLIITAMAALSRPPIPNPDGPGYVAEQNIRSNSATYGALGLTIAVSI